MRYPWQRFADCSHRGWIRHSHNRKSCLRTRERTTRSIASPCSVYRCSQENAQGSKAFFTLPVATLSTTAVCLNVAVQSFRQHGNLVLQDSSYSMAPCVHAPCLQFIGGHGNIAIKAASAIAMIASVAFAREAKKGALYSIAMQFMSLQSERRASERIYPG